MDWGQAEFSQFSALKISNASGPGWDLFSPPTNKFNISLELLCNK
jgi:hypothetical protein